MLGAGDHHARRRDAVVESLEPLGLGAHGCLQRVGMADVLEDDLEGDRILGFRDRFRGEIA
jgi:hypothetical protein